MAAEECLQYAAV